MTHRLYRVIVTSKPEGSDQPNWRPQGPWADTHDFTKIVGSRKFTWPSTRRPYLSRSKAGDRARLIESFGATVEIVHSDPITWPKTNVRRCDRAHTCAREGQTEVDVYQPDRAGAHTPGGKHVTPSGVRTRAHEAVSR